MTVCILGSSFDTRKYISCMQRGGTVVLKKTLERRVPSARVEHCWYTECLRHQNVQKYAQNCQITQVAKHKKSACNLHIVCN